MQIPIFIMFAVAMWMAMLLVVSVPTWLLWNGLIPELFGGPNLSWLQSLGLLLLSSSFFSGRPSIKFTR